ncbi:class I SAM-dependent methyltransferase [Mesorhizobium sp. WSM3626]|uniref:class I SAM-dependent DNA methyltransferase n=1 Tax=Mesorhizobium sp. WSM3626 TaxID=1040987 RepID=UPI0018DC5A1F|nr:class I SAM-dependent methyltransferase [Mesorhizobium sp. WSM3626]
MNNVQRENDDTYPDFGLYWGDAYDEYADAQNKTAETTKAVVFLAGLVGGGTALELGCGNGHIALPLGKAGMQIHGLDSSTRMLSLLDQKNDPHLVQTHHGDMANFDFGMRFDLIYCVNNSFTHLLSVERQLSCLRSVTNALEDDGHFVIHLNYPNTTDFTGKGMQADQRTTVFHVDEHRTLVRFTKHDRNDQIFISQDLWITPEGVRTLPTKLRYVYPSELELLTRFVGLGLVERWGDWERRPVDTSSWSHVSVFRKTDSTVAL